MANEHEVKLFKEFINFNLPIRLTNEFKTMLDIDNKDSEYYYCKTEAEKLIVFAFDWHNAKSSFGVWADIDRIWKRELNHSKRNRLMPRSIKSTRCKSIW